MSYPQLTAISYLFYQKTLALSDWMQTQYCLESNQCIHIQFTKIHKSVWIVKHIYQIGLLPFWASRLTLAPTGLAVINILTTSSFCPSHASNIAVGWDVLKDTKWLILCIWNALRRRVSQCCVECCSQTDRGQSSKWRTVNKLSSPVISLLKVMIFSWFLSF